MSEIPNHTFPPYSEDSRDDALFHYTSADGLIGILQNREIWSTAYHCSNDASELDAGTGILTPEFLRSTQKMVESELVRLTKESKRTRDLSNTLGTFFINPEVIDWNLDDFSKTYGKPSNWPKSENFTRRVD